MPEPTMLQERREHKKLRVYLLRTVEQQAGSSASRRRALSMGQRSQSNRGTKDDISIHKALVNRQAPVNAPVKIRSRSRRVRYPECPPARARARAGTGQPLPMHSPWRALQQRRRSELEPRRTDTQGVWFMDLQPSIPAAVSTPMNITRYAGEMNPSLWLKITSSATKMEVRIMITSSSASCHYSWPTRHDHGSNISPPIGFRAGRTSRRSLWGTSRKCTSTLGTLET